MIADTERLIDGFRGLPAGMDGSKEPPQTPSEAAWYATNVTFRGGNGPCTRSGFREIPSTFWRDPKPSRTVSSLSLSGTLATATSNGHGYTTGDWVTIAGSSVAGANGSFRITVTGTNTFTYATTATGTVTGTVTAFRDVDYTYNQDFVDSKTSRDRYITYIRGATYVQGSFVYQDTREGNTTQLIMVVDGFILALNFNNSSCYLLNLNDQISVDVPVYMVQAEKYLIIQSGKDEPRVYDGYTVRRARYYNAINSLPIGKQMAYGQGRLFVAVNEGSEITAGDLVFSGITTEAKIVGNTVATSTEITTATDHNFTTGDLVTIADNTSIVPSTYVVTVTAAKTFTIPVNVGTAGTGGTATKFVAGQDSDVLRFSETTFLNEGGNLAPSGKIGRITGLAFLPVQDTATGQGDLIAFCERGAVTFQVSAPRDQWKNTEAFQRILFDNIGATSESILSVNGDLFFRSREGNGIRTYRNARAEAGNYGQTPISAEIDPVLRQDTQWMLDQVSLAYFDNRLLMTCLPKQLPRRATDQTQADTFATQPIPTIYEGIAVLDFNSSSVGRGKTAAVFDGVWTGIRILKLVQGTFDGDPRCFAVCFHEDDTGRRIELWEITKNDEYDTPVEGKRRITAGIVTKAFNFRDEMSLKKLIRCDLWFDDLGGGSDYPFECELAYRPDDYPNFTTWENFEREFETDFYIPSYVTTPAEPFNIERGYAPQVRFPTPPLTANIATNVPAYLGHDFTLRINWTGRAHLGRLMLHGQRLTEAVNGGSL
jgi:hypothetical protein